MSRVSVENRIRKYRAVLAKATGFVELVPPGTRLVLALEREFLGGFVELAGRETARARAPRRVFWADSYGRLCNLWVGPYMTPTPDWPKKPLIIRIEVNRSPGYVPRYVIERFGDSCWNEDVSAPPKRSLQLSMRPEELLDFLPWIVRWVDFIETGRSLCDPPHPVRWWYAKMEDANFGWEKGAYEEACAHWRMRDAVREQRRRARQLPRGVA